MKLYCVSFDEEPNWVAIKDAVRKVDPNTIPVVNESTGKKVIELQSETAANALVKDFGGKLTVLEYDMRSLYSNK